MNIKISLVGILAILVGCAYFTNVESVMGAETSTQGWSQHDIDDWFETSQGSRLIPLSWLKALEIENGQTPFLADSNIRKFRYIPRDLRNWNIRLPRGFAIDASKDTNYSEKQTKLRWKKSQGELEPWVGMTCAACHTAEIGYGGAHLTVQGGPTMADFQGFISALDAAMTSTWTDDAKFDRFADAVLLGKLDSAQLAAGRSTPDYLTNRVLLKAALKTRIDWADRVANLVKTDMAYGFGRLDAVGHILNKVALLADAGKATTNPADAPVSYPFLWNVPQHDKVQWNGMVRNIPFPRPEFDIGALGRNTGEVIGVFADVNIDKGRSSLLGLSKFPSSVNINNLLANEGKLRKLKSPAWPEELFGRPDAVLADQGSKIYNQKCLQCHAVLDRNDLSTPIEAKLISLTSRGRTAAIGTDPWMACNTFQFETSTGKLMGSKRAGDPPLGRNATNASILPVVIAGTMLDNKGVIVKNGMLGLFGTSPRPNIARPLGVESTPERESRESRERRCMDESRSQTDPAKDILVYKARPLNGIWATAPYLHNGSVPNLRELLKPSQQRVTVFYVGSNEFDTVNVGFVSKLDPRFPENSFAIDTTKPGNLNSGHDYGVRPDEIEPLLEFMKTL